MNTQKKKRSKFIHLINTTAVSNCCGFLLHFNPVTIPEVNKMQETKRQFRPETEERRLERISKFISMILRHRPEVIGITLDEHGWANVNELIKGINETGEEVEFSKATLEKIVKTDKKQRYSFSHDKTLIRANQGHSIPVDVELEKKEPPKFFTMEQGLGLSNQSKSKDFFQWNDFMSIYLQMSKQPPMLESVMAHL